MNRDAIVSIAFISGLILAGCNSTPRTTTPVEPTAHALPAAAPVMPDTEAQRRAADEKFIREVKKEKHKNRGSAYVIKKKAYTNYIP